MTKARKLFRDLQPEHRGGLLARIVVVLRAFRNSYVAGSVLEVERLASRALVDRDQLAHEPLELLRVELGVVLEHDAVVSATGIRERCVLDNDALAQMRYAAAQELAAESTSAHPTTCTNY